MKYIVYDSILSVVMLFCFKSFAQDILISTVGTQAEGYVLSFEEGVFSIELDSGEIRQIPANNISKIIFRAGDHYEPTNLETEKHRLTIKQPDAVVVLNARTLSSTKDVQTNWETSWGAFDHDLSRAIAVEITIRNMIRQEVNVKLEVVFFAKQGNVRWVFDRVLEDIKLDVSKPFHVVKVSKPLESSVQRYAAFGIKDESGGQIDGYIVRVLQGGSVVRVHGSSQPLRAIAENQQQLEEMIKAWSD